MEGFLFGDSDRYQVHEVLGQGSYGTVYKISNKAGRIYACKVFDAEIAHNPDSYRDFLKETQIGINFLHEHLVSVHKSVLIQGDGFYLPSGSYPAIIMDYVDGPDLETFKLSYEQVKGKPLPRNYGILLLAKVCSGLEVLHQHNIRHGDIKPGNILISKTGYPKITDYGIASVVGEHNSFNGVIGTVRYLAPEQLEQGKDANYKVDLRADLYALGMIALEMTAGLPEAFYDHIGRTILYIVEFNNELLSFVNDADLPSDLKFVIRSCLSKDIVRRPARVRDLQNVFFQTIYGMSKGITLEDIGDVVKKLEE